MEQTRDKPETNQEQTWNKHGTNMEHTRNKSASIRQYLNLNSQLQLIQMFVYLAFELT